MNEPNGLTAKQENAARLIASGNLFDKDVAEVVGVSTTTVSKWKTNGNFSNFVEMLKSELNFNFLQNSSDAQISEVTKKILQKSAPKAALVIAESLENDEPALKNSSARWLLEHTGYGQEKKVDKSININVDVTADEFKDIMKLAYGNKSETEASNN